MTLNEFRERANLWLYGNKDKVLHIFKILNLIISVAAILTLIYYYGYEHSSEDENWIFSIIKASFAFYVFYYVVRFVYDFHPLEFLKESMFEGFLMLFLVIEGISFNFFDVLILELIFERFGFANIRDLTVVILQLYFFVVVLIELQKTTSILPQFKVHPSYIFIGSLMALITGGTFLLMLPEMTTAAGSMGFIDALFSSTSASCVTGLMTVDTETFFTFKGHVVLLILMQLGGLNIIAFGSFLALAAKFGVNVKQHDVLEDFVHKDSFLSAQGLLAKVVLWSISIEIIGAICLFLTWDEKLQFSSTGNKVFSSIFHSVSAFNNAGISTMTDGFYNEAVRDNYLVHWVITIVVFFGALGVMAIFDIFDPSALRDRLKNPWKRLTFQTKIALYFSIWLVIAGSVLYYILEYNNTLKELSTFGAITTSVFQSVTRTSGFNSTDIGAIGIPMLFVLTILMFIGSSSSSTGGGIKTSTFAIIYADVMATIKGRNYAELFQRTISSVLKSRAYSVLLFFIVGNLICIFLLSITEQHILEMEGRTIMDLIFEEVSAMGTVGLSMGITASLSVYGKFIIMISMLVGRVGTLTVAFALSRHLISKNYKYPEGHTMVG